LGPNEDIGLASDPALIDEKVVMLVLARASVTHVSKAIFWTIGSA